MNSDGDSESFDIHDDQKWSSLISFYGNRKWLRHHYVMYSSQITQKYLFLPVYSLSRILNQIESVKHCFDALIIRNKVSKILTTRWRQTEIIFIPAFWAYKTTEVHKFLSKNINRKSVFQFLSKSFSNAAHGRSRTNERSFSKIGYEMGLQLWYLSKGEPF